MEEVIVVGGNHHNTLGVLRSLGYKGIYPNLILVGGDSHSYTRYSKFIKQLYDVENEEGAIAILIKEKSKFKRPVVISCSDGMSSALDLHRDELVDTYALPCSNITGRLTSFMNKESMSKLGRDIGFMVPPSWVVETIGDIDPVEYPCITKPILSKDGHKSDIKICSSREDLIAVIYEGSCYRYQVQKYIEKDFEYQLIGLSLNAGNQLIIPGFSRCIRPCPSTNTGFLHYEVLDGFNAPLDKCENFVKEVGYSGLFSIEFLRDKNGVDYFMEMNFRNDGNAICVTASGTNLPYIWYLANTSGDYKTALASSKVKAVYVMPEFDDFKRFVATKKISFIQWLKDVYRSDKFMEYDSKDKRPFFVEVANTIKRFLKKK